MAICCRASAHNQLKKHNSIPVCVLAGILGIGLETVLAEGGRNRASN